MRRVTRGIVGLFLAVVLLANTAGLAFAFVEKDGTKNCGNYIAYIHVRYNDIGYFIPPGSTGVNRSPNDGLWHVEEFNGDYSGYWYALGDPSLDLNGTYAACRNYGSPGQ